MVLRPTVFCLLLSVTLAVTCNNPLAEYYGITLLAESATQPSDATACIALNGQDSCCGTAALGTISDEISERTQDLRGELGEQMASLKAVLDPIKNLEFPAEYSEFQEEYSLAIKFASQTALKAFRKVNIEVSRCLKRLLFKEIGEMCSVCNPSAGGFISGDSDVIVVQANTGFCTKLQQSCLPVIEARQELPDKVLITLSDVVTFLTALGAGEQSEVDLSKLEEASVTLANDEERRQKLLEDNSGKQWSDLSGLQQDQYSLRVINQQVSGYDQAREEYGEYFPDEDTIEDYIEEEEEEEEDEEESDEDDASEPDGDNPRRLYAFYGEAKAHGIEHWHKGCVAGLLEQIIWTMSAKGHSFDSLIMPVQEQIIKWNDFCSEIGHHDDDFDLRSDEWFSWEGLKWRRHCRKRSGGDKDKDKDNDKDGDMDDMDHKDRDDKDDKDKDKDDDRYDMSFDDEEYRRKCRKWKRRFGDYDGDWDLDDWDSDMDMDMDMDMDDMMMEFPDFTLNPRPLQYGQDGPSWPSFPTVYRIIYQGVYFQHVTQGANGRCYNLIAKEIQESGNSFTRDIHDQAAFLEILKRVESDRVSNNQSLDVAEENFRELTYRSLLNDEYRDAYDDRWERRNEGKYDSAEEKRDIKSAEGLAAYISGLMAQMYRQAHEGVDRLDSEQDILKEYSRFLISLVREFRREARKRGGLEAVWTELYAKSILDIAKIWELDLKLRQKGASEEEIEEKVFDAWKESMAKRDKKGFQLHMEYAKKNHHIPASWLKIMQIDSEGRLRIAAPVSAAHEMIDQQLRTQQFDWIFLKEEIANVNFDGWSFYKTEAEEIIRKSSENCKQNLWEAFRKEGFNRDFAAKWVDNAIPPLLESTVDKISAWVDYLQDSRQLWDNIAKERWNFERFIYNNAGGQNALPKIGAFLSDASIAKLRAYWESNSDADKATFESACAADATALYQAMDNGTATREDVKYSYTKQSDEELYARMFTAPKDDVLNFPDYLDTRMTSADKKANSGKVKNLRVSSYDDTQLAQLVQNKCQLLSLLNLYQNNPSSLSLEDNIGSFSAAEIALLKSKVQGEPLDFFGTATDLGHQYAVLVGFDLGLAEESRDDKKDTQDDKSNEDGRKLASVSSKDGDMDKDGDHDRDGDFDGDHDDRDRGDDRNKPNTDFKNGPVYYSALFVSLPDTEKEAVLAGTRTHLQTGASGLLSTYYNYFKITRRQKGLLGALAQSPFNGEIAWSNIPFELGSVELNWMMMWRLQWATFLGNSLRFKTAIPDAGRVKRNKNVFVPKSKWNTVTDAEKISGFKKSPRYSAVTGLELDSSITLPSVEYNLVSYEAPCDPDVTDDCKEFICEELAADPAILTSLETSEESVEETQSSRRLLATSISYEYTPTGGIDPSSEGESAGVTVDAAVDGLTEDSPQELQGDDVVAESAVDSALDTVEESSDVIGTVDIDGNVVGGEENDENDSDDEEDEEKKEEESKESASVLSGSVFAIAAILSFYLF